MIFRPEMAELILAGKKTQTRRAVKYSDRGKAIDCRYVAGKSYAIQPGRGKRATERLTVLEVHTQRLGDADPADVRREGFRTRDEFFAYWIELHGTLDEDLQVHVITFAKGDLTDQPRLLRGTSPAAPTCQAPVKRSDGTAKPCGRAFPDNDYLTGRPVEICKCGARRPPETQEDHGYTSRRSNAMRGEGEAVPADVQKSITQRVKDNKANGYIVQRERLLAVISDIRPFALDRATIEHLQGIERQVRALDRKILRVA